MSRSQNALLSPNEEVTLRRVARGQSDRRMLRAEDIARLRALGLIEEDPTTDALTLSVEGRQRFDALPGPALPAGSGRKTAWSHKLHE
jgi:hypothetical protein